jgi:hypothetical protein
MYLHIFHYYTHRITQLREAGQPVPRELLTAQLGAGLVSLIRLT